ncbi:MAG TPA: energy transducer TonB, partial [Sphingomonas sp.]
MRSIALVAAIHLALGYALLTGLGVDLPEAVEERLQVFDVIAPPEPPTPAPTARAPERQGEAAPPAL